MKLTDHESDITATLRLDPTATTAGHRPVFRESWLDKLARHLGATPVDHMTIPPVTFAPTKVCGGAAGVSCSG
ncbi:MAG: hypothetical protein KF715_13375 [Candidatus Didemnitutus sp.]|nr:hypothetical protein [Candidatus Didemnitutus sp.]